MIAVGKSNRNIEPKALVRDGVVFASFDKRTGVANGAWDFHVRYQKSILFSRNWYDHQA
jgi:hypothetical protein